MKARIVIGSSFGDEGKGLVTDWLCSQGAGVVVRFNGGAQAGHTVVTPEGERHVFQHFGSGSFQGIPTFLSQFFVCNPILFFQELKNLQALGYQPDVYVHPDCVITTYADMMINQRKEEKRAGKRHGSCGVGIHETMQRSCLPELKITMSDLWNGGARLEKQLKEICGEWANYRTGSPIKEPEMAKAFLKCCQGFAEYVNPGGIGQCQNPVFEGAQGLLLDQNNTEYRPYLTHSNTGMENVRTLCSQAGITEQEIYYVSRTYLTRHGAGPLPGEDCSLLYEDDTNQPHKFQGTLRFAPLDGDLRARCSADAKGQPYKLVLTHCDQKGPDREADFYSYGPIRTAVSREAMATV